jgi:hypothetical protein
MPSFTSSKLPVSLPQLSANASKRNRRLHRPVPTALNSASSSFSCNEGFFFSSTRIVTIAVQEFNKPAILSATKRAAVRDHNFHIQMSLFQIVVEAKQAITKEESKVATTSPVAVNSTVSAILNTNSSSSSSSSTTTTESLSSRSTRPLTDKELAQQIESLARQAEHNAFRALQTTPLGPSCAGRIRVRCSPTSALSTPVVAATPSTSAITNAAVDTNVSASARISAQKEDSSSVSKASEMVFSQSDDGSTLCDSNDTMQTTEEISFVAGNPEIQLTRGAIHLFKLKQGDVSGDDSDEPANRSALVCVPAVPAYVSPAHFVAFMGEHVLEVRHIRIVADERDDRYMALLVCTVMMSFAFSRITEIRDDRRRRSLPTCATRHALQQVLFQCNDAVFQRLNASPSLLVAATHATASVRRCCTWHA